MYSSRIRHLISVVVLGASVLVPARGVAAQTSVPTGAEDFAGGLKNLVQVVLRADRAPAPGDLATLTFAAAPMIDVPDLQTEWILPSGAELLGGPLAESHGALTPGQSVSLTRQVRFLTTGVYKVVAQAHVRLSTGAQFAASGVLFYTIKADGTSIVSTKDPAAVNPQHSLMETEVKTGPALPRSAARPENVEGDPCFNVTGRIMRTDRPITSAGRGNGVSVPVRFAKVQMRESDTLFDDSYGDTTTDANGNFSFSFCDDDGVFDDTLELYVRLRADLRAGGRDIVEVEDSSWIDEVYEFDSGQQSSDGGSLTFNLTLNEMQSSVFNIADAVFEADQFWNASGGANGGDAIFGEESEVHWEPGYGDKGSYYMSFWEEITIADDPSDSDEWDDSVIMHEWAHSSDDEYSCDDNPGGQHFVNQLVSDPELSWGEGYPDYYQSAVRAARGDAAGNFYFDINASGNAGIILDLETWDTTQPTLVSVLNEFAIAAALWDLNDTTNDGGDRVSVGHPTLQSVFTSSSFESNGFFDDTCTFNTYMQSWKDIGKPTDGATAAAVTQNTGLANPFSTLLAATSLAQADAGTDGKIADQAFSPESVLAPESDPHYFDNYKWWKQLTLIADNSASMAGTKFGAVKTVLTEQVNDLANEPKGVEFALHTFNNNSAILQNALAGRFYADQIVPAINGLGTVGTADPNCQVQSLGAMLQSLPGKHGGEAWLFTDGDSGQTDVNNLRQALASHQVRGSFALLGGCNSAPGTAPNLVGPQKAFLGKTANRSQPVGIVPYLLTAISSGGQFLYVGQNQMSDAADIMRAQLTHSAGAGRWSDYVSDSQTYVVDKLSSWEYQWQELSSGTVPGVVFGQSVTFNQPFTYWDVPRTGAQFSPNGYAILGGSVIPNPRIENTTLPNPAVPNNAIYPLWDLTSWDYLICAAQAQQANGPASPDAPACGGEQAFAYSLQTNNLVTMEMTGTVYPSSYKLGYQIILNTLTGEIRFQYRSNQPNFASSATIGLENNTGALGVQVSYNDASGASDGMGYKFTPAPPQPSKIYTVPVDSAMSSVGFLLTGYSGSFDPLAPSVLRPDGSAISCADTAHVLCLNLGLVQYVQADVQGQTGVWTATVSAGPSGAGTFSFSSMAVSPISVDSPSDHSRATADTSALLINLGQAISSNTVQGWLQQPNGAPLCAPFSLFDDGAHGDGRAGDGRFGSAAFTACPAGTGYLHVKGTHNGTNFERVDPVPFTFQPIRVTSLGDGVVLGANTSMNFRIQNYDIVQHCYRANWQLPEGWTSSMNLSLSETRVGVCVSSGNSIVKTLVVTPTAGLPSGATGEVHLSFNEREQGIMSDSATAKVTRYNFANRIEIVNEFFHNYIRPNNVDTATLNVAVTDAQGVNVADGTQVQLASSLGSVSPATGATLNGQIPVTFTAGTIEGDVIVTATEVATGIQATTTLHIHAPVPDRIDLVASPQVLDENGTSSALLATVYDRWNNPMPNQTVRIGVEGDGQVGTVNGAEVLTGTTNAQGQIVGNYAKGDAVMPVGVRAELLDGPGFTVIHEDREVIAIGKRIYLPVLQR